MTTLVIYASREGQTYKVSKTLAEHLKAQGEDFEMLSLQQVVQDTPNLDAYDKIVIGASIHYGHFPSLLYYWLEQNAAVLNKKKTYFVALCLVARKPGKDTIMGNVYVRKFLAKTPWKPTDVGIFAGAINYAKLNVLDRTMVKFIMWMMKAPTSSSGTIEFTDWAKVEAFANKVAN